MTTTLINQQEEKNMSTKTLTTNEETAMTTATNTTTNQEVNTMNLFADIALPEQETKSPIDWTLEDCKNNLKVIFRKCSQADTYIVSVNLGGLTALKVFNGKTTFKMKKGLMEKEEILARVRDKDSIVEEARERLIISLRKAKQSREMKQAQKLQEGKELKKQYVAVLTKAMNQKNKEELQDVIDLANLSEQVEKIESDQAISPSLSI
jgi:hypothetical protein